MGMKVSNRVLHDVTNWAGLVRECLFVDSGFCIRKLWLEAACLILIAGNVSARPGDPDDLLATVERNVSAASVSTNTAGNVVFDFGREAFGRLEIMAPEGSSGECVVRLGELLDGAGGVNMHPGATIRSAEVRAAVVPGAWSRVPLVADKRNTSGGREGRAAQVRREHGVVMPFRYAEFVSAPFALGPDSVRQVAVEYPVDRGASSFRCSDERINRVYDFCRHSTIATTFAGLYVDGDRERIPYEGDAYINQLCEYAVHSDYALARASHEYLMSHATWPTEWKQHSVMMAWTDWMWTGDKRSLERCYDGLKKDKLLDSCRRNDGLLHTGGRRSKDIVDWPVSERDGFEFREVNAVVNAFYCRNLRQMADIAAALGKKDDASFFAQRAEESEAAFRKTFFDEARGVFVDGAGAHHASLHANAIALAFGLAPKGREGGVADFCVSRGMACSPYFAQYLLDGLFAAGRADAAIALMTASGERSWLGMMEFGATITMEAWSVRIKPNLDMNHAWGAAPINVISRHLLGVTPLEPGFAKISIRPSFGSLESASGVVPTAKGGVRVNYAAGVLHVETPAPARVEFAGKVHDIRAGASGHFVNRRTGL